MRFRDPEEKMAAPMRHISEFISNTLEQLFVERDIAFRKIEVIKKDNHSNKGDLFLSRACLGVNDDEIILALKDELLARCHSSNIQVKNITSDKFHSLVIHLERPQCCKKIVETILKEGASYGCGSQDIVSQQRVVLNSVAMTADRDQTSPEASVDIVRALLIQMHAALLLKFLGYTVECLSQKTNLCDQNQIMTRIGVTEEMFTKCSRPSDDELHSLTDSFVKHPCVEISDRREQSSDVERQQCEESSQPQSFQFNMRKYIQEQSLSVGNTQYDKNLSLCNLTTAGKESDVLKQAIFLTKCLKQSQPCVCVHIVNQACSFNQQKVQLLLLALSDLPEHISHSKKVSQSLCVYGPVLPGKGTTPTDKLTADQYLRLRYDQMKQAAISKYGEAVTGDGWETTLNELTSACIKFELLSTSAKSQVKINMCEDTSGEVTLAGSFVMYNCARLATLFSHFEEAVQGGTYPPLPGIEKIDFTLLREEQEWGLVWNHLCALPEVVNQSVSHFVTTETIHAGLHTHKVCLYLTSLSRALSSYYSRYHVLGEGRPQLLPTMYARIYLLRAVHQVFINGLALLNIQPLSQL